jgi:hypothetical protein
MKEHPEDRIYKDKKFIRRLQRLCTNEYHKLVEDLNLTLDGNECLFDYIYNCDDNDITFSEHLARYDLTLENVIKSNE